jgi:RHS repeat-associated protein
MPGKTGLDWAGYICYQRIVRVSLISDRVAGWLWLTCLLGLLGVWDLSAKVPSSCLGGKTLPSGCAWNLNNNNGTATRFTVDTLNQLTDGPTSPCTNDNNGNLTGQVNYYAYGYSYDDEDQLTSVIFSGISKSDFKYDGLGRLRQRQEYTWYGYWFLSSTVNYVYDGRRVIQERDGNNTPTVSYTRGSDLSGGLEGDGGIGGLLARSHGYSGGNWSTHNYYHADGGGNITYLMNSSQTATATYKYDPFGTTLAQSGTLASANVYRFSSKEFHSASSLYYFGFRFYDPNLQRWPNRDPIQEAGGINLFGFIGNNPICHADFYGLDPAFSPGISMFSGLSSSQQVQAAKKSAPLTVGIVASVATGGAANVVLVGTGLMAEGSLATAITVGAMSGLGGDAAFQGTSIALGGQQGFNLPEFGLSGAVGGVVGGTANKLSPVCGWLRKTWSGSKSGCPVASLTGNINPKESILKAVYNADTGQIRIQFPATEGTHAEIAVNAGWGENPNLIGGYLKFSKGNITSGDWVDASGLLPGNTELADKAQAATQAIISAQNNSL